MMVMLAIYFEFFSPELPNPEVTDNSVVDNYPNKLPEKINNEAKTDLTLNSSDSTLNQLNNFKYGLFSSKITGEEAITKLTTNDLEVTTNKGGTFKNVNLKNYTTYDSLPLNLFDKTILLTSILNISQKVFL